MGGSTAARVGRVLGGSVRRGCAPLWFYDPMTCTFVVVDDGRDCMSGDSAASSEDVQRCPADGGCPDRVTIR